MQCLLKGSEKYCETGRGICCQSCMEYETCEKPAGFVHPVPKPWEGGGTHAR